MDIKEIVNLLYTAIDLAADGGPKAFTEEEYSEMHELLEKIKSGQFGWHPASELPSVDEFGESEYLIAYDLDGYAFSAFYSRKNGWCDDDGRNNLEIEWWSYPPNEE